MSKLRTYSKSQKTVDCPAIFTNVDSNKMDISLSEEQEQIKTKTTKRQAKKEPITKKDDEEMIIEQEPQSEETNKRSTRIRKPVTKENEEPVQAVVKPKRKTTKTTQKSEIKLFQNSNSEESMNTESMSAPPIPPIPPIVETKTSRGRTVTKAKQTLRSTSSASNLQVKKTAARSTTQDKENKRTLAKSSSVSNFNKKPSELISMETNDTKELKSIMKQSKPDDDSETDVKNKRAVRILAKIDDKNDQLANLKIDNKTKHSASTSTPSGMRRRPLKAPQDVSMIIKS